MEVLITNEDELEQIAIKIGQLKDVLSGSQEALELNAMMQAMIKYEKKNPINFNESLLEKQICNN